MNKITRTIILFFAALLIFTSCSSQPKSQGDIFDLRIQAETLLESGNSEAAKGNFENALILLNESMRRAILADDPSLLIRCSLSRGNVLFSLGHTDEAFLEWEHAVTEAQKIRNSELLAISRIYHARGMLVSGRDSARSVLDIVNREQGNIKSKNAQLYTAFTWQVRGLALRAMGSYTEAEAAVRRSLQIHEKGKYLENASYDWYTIASIRSLSGNTAGALAALESSIALDRRVENSWGLAASWRAMGDVYSKSGRTPEAREAYIRAITIYAAMGNDYEVLETERRMNL